MTEVEREINTSDVNARLRDVENKFLDFKSNFEKRVLVMLEENPQKYLRHLKVMEDKDSALWKDSFQKQSKLEDDLRLTQDLLKKQNEALFNKVLTLENQVQDCYFKIRSNPPPPDPKILSLDSNEYTGNMVVYDPRTAAMNQTNGSSNNNPLEIEVKLLKEGLFQEQSRRDTLFKDIMGLYKDLNGTVHKHEAELMSRLKKQKEELAMETTASKDQLKKIEQFKTETMTAETGLLKNMLSSLEKRLQEETERRLVLEYDVKRLLDDRLQGIKDENVRNEKNFLENEQKYMKQVQESFSSLNQIMKSNKDTLEADLAASQTLTNENLRTLSKTLDFLRETLTGKLVVLDGALKEQSLTLSGVVNDNNRKIEEFHKGITKELERNEKIIGVFEGELGRILKETEGKLEGNTKTQEEWRKKFEGKTQGILKEMSGMLKGIRDEVHGDRADKEERMRQLAKEQENISKMHQDLLANMRAKLENLNEAFEYKLKEMSINWQASKMEQDQKTKENLEDLRRSFQERLEKEIVDNIYNLNQKLTLEFKKDIKEGQEINKAIMEDNRQRILTDLAYNDQKAENMVNKLREEFSHKNNTNIKQIQVVVEDMRSHKEENKENLRKLKLDMDGSTEKLGNQLENKIFASALDLKEDFNRSINQQNKETKENLNKNAQEAALGLRNLEERVQKELEHSGVTVIGALKEEMLQEVNRVNEGFKAMEQTIDSNKRMLLEAISQNSESTKALCRALIVEEGARREKALDDLLKLIKKSLDTLEELLNNKMEKLSEELNMRLKEKTEELEKNMFELEKRVSQDLKDQRELNERWFAELSTEIYLEKALRKQRESEYDETIKNVEVRFINVEEALVKSNGKNEVANRELVGQIEGNRAILMENYQVILEHQKVIKDHEEGLVMIEVKIGEIDDTHKAFEEKTITMNEELKDHQKTMQQELKDHNGRLEILKEDVLDNKSAISKVAEDLAAQGVRINENLAQKEEKIIEITEQLKKDQKDLQKIDDELNGNNANMYEMDDKFSKHIEKVYLDMESRNYLNDLYNQIQQEEGSNSENYLKAKINKTSYQVTKIMEKIDESDKIFDQFELKTDNNFQIAEKAIKAHTRFLNEIDARLTIEELYNKVCHRGAEENLKKSVFVINQQIESISNQQNENNNGSLKGQLEMVTGLRELEEKTKEHQEKIEGIQEKTREHQEKIEGIQEMTQEQQKNIEGIQGKNQTLFKAVKNHENFLNELDAKMVIYTKG